MMIDLGNRILAAFQSRVFLLFFLFYVCVYLGFITKAFGLSEFALIGNWTILAFHGHKVAIDFNHLGIS